mmetsp:Transcript_12738/g.42009  ORF Transcript_12738/g.42009 Transcript_12738/m.42009 type:complete len:217 (+) Transcript_12738:126-776(+)
MDTLRTSGSTMWVADGDSFFHRSGPRLVQAGEIIAEAAFPELLGRWGHHGVSLFTLNEALKRHAQVQAKQKPAVTKTDPATDFSSGPEVRAIQPSEFVYEQVRLLCGLTESGVEQVYEMCSHDFQDRKSLEDFREMLAQSRFAILSNLHAFITVSRTDSVESEETVLLAVEACFPNEPQGSGEKFEWHVVSTSTQEGSIQWRTEKLAAQTIRTIEK